MEHLPECHLVHKCHGFTGVEGKHVMKMDYCEACHRPCICESLRACEQRVRRSLWQECYDAALDAAEQAVIDRQ